MGGKTGQAPMQPVELYMIAIGHLIKEPKDPMNSDLFYSGQFAQNSVAGQQRPRPRFRKGESKGIGHRELLVLAIDASRSPQFGNREFLHAQPVGNQPVSQFPLEFADVEEIGHRELERQQKHLIEKIRPFEVDDDRSVGDQNRHGSGCHLIQSSIELAHGNAEQFGGPRLPDHTFGQCAIA